RRRIHWFSNGTSRTTAMRSTCSSTTRKSCNWKDCARTSGATSRPGGASPTRLRDADDRAEQFDSRTRGGLSAITPPSICGTGCRLFARAELLRPGRRFLSAYRAHLQREEYYLRLRSRDPGYSASSFKVHRPPLPQEPISQFPHLQERITQAMSTWRT